MERFDYHYLNPPVDFSTAESGTAIHQEPPDVMHHVQSLFANKIENESNQHL